MANEYTLGGPPPQSRSEKILMKQNPGPAQSRIEELLKSASGRTSGALVYKGTVETALSLPSSGNEVGDMYHVNSDGSEWAWNGEQWEELGKSSSILYTPQTLTDAQQAQARKNIGSKPPIYLAWDDTVDPGICEKSATEIGLLVDDGYDVHILVQAFRGYDLRFRSVFAKDGAPVAEFGVVFIKEDGSLENLTVTVDEQKHVELVRTHVSSAELEISQEIDDWADGKALDAGAAKDALNQVLDDVGDELDSKANASDLARVATTGSYNDLSDKPTIPTVPTLAAVATSGSYNDLSDKPTIPSLTGYATETWVEGKGYQTAQQVQTAIAAIPTELPAVTASDNGKFLRVVNGAWAAETVSTWQGGSY